MELMKWVKPFIIILLVALAILIHFGIDRGVMGHEMPLGLARDTTVKLEYKLNDGMRLVGTGTVMDGKVVTAAHVCNYVTKYMIDKHMYVTFPDGYRSAAVVERSQDSAVFDVCVIKLRQFVGVRERLAKVPDVEVAWTHYGDIIMGVTMYSEPGWIVYGPVGSNGCSKIRGNVNAGTVAYLNVGAGGSGSGLWDEGGHYVGMLIQAKLIRTTTGARFAAGYAFFIPGPWVWDYLQTGQIHSEPVCQKATNEGEGE